MVTYFYCDPAHALYRDWNSPLKQDGLKETGLTIDSSADTTHFVDSGLSSTLNDKYNGDFVWNITRQQASYVLDYDGATKTVTLSTPITDMAAGDEYYMIHARFSVTYFLGLDPWEEGLCLIRAGTTELAYDNYSWYPDYEGNKDWMPTWVGMGTGTASLERTDGSAYEAWHDASVDRPIWNFAQCVNYYEMARDYTEYDRLENIRFINGSTTVAQMELSGCHGGIFKNLYMTAPGICVNVENSDDLWFEDCIFEIGSAGIEAFLIIDPTCQNMTFKNCTFRSLSALATTYVIRAMSGSYTGVAQNIFFDGCTFDSFKVLNGGGMLNGRFRNCKFINMPSYYYKNNSSFGDGYIDYKFEDEAQILNANVDITRRGIVERVTDIVRNGGASTSVKMTPAYYDDEWLDLGATKWMKIQRDNVPDFSIWCPAEETTITIYLRGFNWSAFPTASQLWVSAEYVTNGNNGEIARTVVNSSEAISDNTTWVAFVCTVTPAAPAWVNISVNLGLTEDGTQGIYVDHKPVIS
jgi:hypothetical protein